GESGVMGARSPAEPGAARKCRMRVGSKHVQARTHLRCPDGGRRRRPPSSPGTGPGRDTESETAVVAQIRNHGALLAPWGCAAHARRANKSAPTGVPMAASAFPTKLVGVIVAHNNPVAAPLFREHPPDGAAALASHYRNAITT